MSAAQDASDHLSALLSSTKVEVQSPIPGAITIVCTMSVVAATALAERLEQADRDKAALWRVKALHAPYGIYDECEHDHDESELHDPSSEVLEIDDVGLVCADGLMYWACRECCIDDPYYSGQTEGCASNHKHSKDESDRCPTVRAIDDGEAIP